jgi:hypothetical protein
VKLLYQKKVRIKMEKGILRRSSPERRIENLCKKRAKIEKLQKVPEGTSQKENLQNWNFVGISEQHHMALPHGNEI